MSAKDRGRPPTGDSWAPLAGLAIHAAGTMSYPPGATFGPRRLTDYELVWFIHGDCVAYRNGRAIAAPEGTLLLQTPGTRDAYDWAKGRTTLHGFIHFGMRRPGRGWPPVSRWPTHRRPPSDDLMLTLFRFILGLHRSASEGRAAMLLPGLELLVRGFVSGESQVPSELHEPFPDAVTRTFELARARLQEQPASALRLRDLARHAHVSQQHLCRIFQRALGRGPMECVRLLRIEQAATLLERSEDPVRLIADRCGFVSPYHFSRVFRQVYGTSPRQYRRGFQLGVRHGVARPRRPAVFGDDSLRWLLRR